MKRGYPSYKNITLESVYNTLSFGNKKLVDDFLNYCKITAGESSIKKIYGAIVQIADVFEKPLDKLDLEDLRKFLALLNSSNRSIETQNDIKKILKRFLRWKYKDWSLRFDGFRDVRTKDGMNHEKLNSSTILTGDELEMIINNVESLKLKALILLMFESAGRPEEILKLMWRDINFDKAEVKLHSAKTGKTRVNPINKSLAQLRRYKEECFYPFARSDDFVFPNPRNKENHMTVQAINDSFSKIEKRLGLKKRFFPYILRHTKLTELIQKLSPKIYEKFSGHSIQVGIKRYAHISNDDVRRELSEKIYNIEKLSPIEKNELKREIEQLKEVYQIQGKELSQIKALLRIVLQDSEGIANVVENRIRLQKVRAH